MFSVTVSDRSGQEHVLEAEKGLTLMEVIRDAGLDELLALCGGSLSCATCHVRLDPAFHDLTAPVSQDENDLLDSSSHRGTFSRLSCQIVLDEHMAGLRATIAPED